MDQRATILIVEDEPEILNINVRMMKRHGYDVITATSVEESLSRLSEGIPDLLILDIMLPDGSGYDICEAFRRTSDNPVVFLTGKVQLSDKVEGLGRGGDYYLTKPYSFDELLAVVQRLLTRHFGVQERHKQLAQIKKGPLTLELSANKALVNGEDVHLTAKEFALLLILVKNEEKIVSPETLYEAVWRTGSANDTRTVRFHIKNLKRKLNTENSKEYGIVSVYGKGYSFTTN